MEKQDKETLILTLDLKMLQVIQDSLDLYNPRLQSDAYLELVKKVKEMKQKLEQED